VGDAYDYAPRLQLIRSSLIVCGVRMLLLLGTYLFCEVFLGICCSGMGFNIIGMVCVVVEAQWMCLCDLFICNVVTTCTSGELASGYMVG